MSRYGKLSHRRERGTAHDLDGHLPVERGEVQFHRLQRARHVRHAQHVFVVVFAQIGQHLAVTGVEELQAAAPERLVALAHGEHAAGPVEQGVRIARLRFHIDGLEAVQRVHDRRKNQARRIGARESAIAIHRPLHRRTHAVAIAQVDVVAHADLVAVIQHRRSRHRQQQRVHQFDTATVAFEQGRETAADAQVDPRAAIRGIGLPEVIALVVGHHLEGQLVVVAQEDRPLAVVRDRRRLPHDVRDREAVLAGDRHVHARHQREMEGHVAFVAVAEVILGVLGPLIGLGQEHAVRVVLVDLGADQLEDRVRLGQVLVVGALALDQVRHRVQAQAVHAQVQPEAHHVEHRLEDRRVVEIQVRLVREEAVPEVLAGHRVPCPVRLLGIEEDDARTVIGLVGVRPDVEIRAAEPFFALRARWNHGCWSRCG